jgi:phosphinothricin acetyltransferase
MIIRDAVIQDMGAIAHIHNSYLGTATLDLETRDPHFFEQLLFQKDDREKFLVLTLNDMVIGYGRLMKYSYKLGYQYAGETSVFLHPAYVSRGYGHQLKKHLIILAKELKYHHLIARIMADNHVSIKYNKQLGYSLVGIQREIGYHNGRWVDVAVMQLIL